MADKSVNDSSLEDFVLMKNVKNIEPQVDPINTTIEHSQKNDNMGKEVSSEHEVSGNTNEEEEEEKEDSSVSDGANEEGTIEENTVNCEEQMDVAEVKYSEEEIAAYNKVAEAVRTFAHGFHERIAEKSGGNFVCSGLSVHSVLSMAAQGAGGDTAASMQQALWLPEDRQQSCVGYRCLINDMNNAKQMVFKLADKVYVSSDREVKEKFKETTSTYFNSESESLDFTKRKEAAAKINDWCTKTTDGKIKNIFSEKYIDGSVNFILLNALYFKGVWEKKFLHTFTTMKPYHIDKNTVKEVPMMYNKKYYLYNELEDESAHFVGIPYENDNYCMFIIVPKEIDGLAKVEKNYELIKKAFETLKDTRRITLHLPKFKISSTIDLKPHLCEMGMAGIFDDNADFSGITNQSGGATSVRQKVFIEVNEDGTEALSFTDFLIKRKYDANVPLELMVDRPFLYQIYDQRNGIPLFSGRIVDPTIIEDS